MDSRGKYQLFWPILSFITQFNHFNESRSQIIVGLLKNIFFISIGK